MKQIISISPLVLVTILSISSTAFAGGDRTRLECDGEGVGGDFSMDARFEERRNRERFDASFEAAPGGAFAVGDNLGVSVGGVSVGEITLSALPGGDLGGDLEYDTQADEMNPFPADFPEVADGTSVIVGPLGCDLED